MIGRLSGILLEKNPPQILLDVQGVGYEVNVPMSTFYNLPALHERVLLHNPAWMRQMRWPVRYAMHMGAWGWGSLLQKGCVCAMADWVKVAT